MNFFSEFLYGVDTIAQLVLLGLLVRGPFRKYIVFSLYILIALAAGVSESTVYYKLGRANETYRAVYWGGHITQALLLFLVVIAFTYASLRDNPLRPKAAKVLGAIVAVAVVLPFAFLPNHHSNTHGSFTSQWFNHVIQIFNFAATIMNLVLWGALLTNRRRDPQLVSLSIGLGIATASAAIAWGARQWLSEANRWPVDLFMTASHILSISIWCWALRPKRRNAGPGTGTGTGTGKGTGAGTDIGTGADTGTSASTATDKTADTNKVAPRQPVTTPS